MALTEYLSDDLQPSEDALYRHRHRRGLPTGNEACSVTASQVSGDFQNHAMGIKIRLRVNLYMSTD